MAKTRLEAFKEIRPKRVSIADQRDIITAYNIPENKVPRWVLDKPGRIAQFLLAGYEFVTDKGITIGERTVDGTTAANGTVYSKQGTKEGTMLYLMAIDKDLYNEDQVKKQAIVDQMEEEIYDFAKQPGQYGSIEQTVTRHRSL